MKRRLSDLTSNLPDVYKAKRIKSKETDIEDISAPHLLSRSYRLWPFLRIFFFENFDTAADCLTFLHHFGSQSLSLRFPIHIIALP
jgi:hypothetical protein